MVSVAEACARVTDGTHYTPPDAGSGVPFLTVKDMRPYGLDFDTSSHITAGEFDKAKSAGCVPSFGDVLFSKDGTVGKVHVVSTSRPFAVLSSIAILTPQPDVDSRYLGHFLRTSDTLAAAGRMKTGSAIRRIILSDLKKLTLPKPSLEDQRRIADVLDRADVLRTKRHESLGLLEKLSQSIFLEMFGQLESTVEFGSLITSGPTNGLYRPLSDYGSGTPILRIDGFDSGEVKPGEWKRLRVSPSDLERYSLGEGDIVINRVNALSHLGKSALIERLDERAVFESNMMRIRLDRDQAEPRYVIAWLQTPSVKQQILARAKKSINQASINQSDVRSLTVPLAPQARQVDFAQRIQRVAAQRDAVRRALVADSELFAVLQQRAFTGLL